MSLEQPAACVLVDRLGVVLVDDVTAVGDAILRPGPATLDRSVEKIHVRIERKLGSGDTARKDTAPGGEFQGERGVRRLTRGKYHAKLTVCSVPNVACSYILNLGNVCHLTFDVESAESSFIIFWRDGLLSTTPCVFEGYV